MNTTIPLVDLQAQQQEVSAEITAGFSRVIADASFILGEDVARFEEEYAQFIGVEHCVGVANGTDALELVLRSLDIGTGDEVILPANTFIATALAVARAGARPVLVDCDDEYLLIDPPKIAERMTPSTKAVIAVHLYGQAAPVEEVQSILGSTGTLIEDAAQAQGARRNGNSAGAFGVAAGVSFYPGKNLGAFGDAGAVLTNNAEIAARTRALRNYGSERKYHHPERGFNSRLDTLQAVVLRAKLKRLDAWNMQRRGAATRYDDLLRDLPEVRRPTTLPGNQHIWHLYVVRVPRRDDVLRQLQMAGIGAGVHYPVPMHLQGAFEELGYRRGDFPVTERAAAELLSLPIYPQITAAQQVRVVDVLRRALRGSGASRGGAVK